MVAAPAEVPGVEEIARVIASWRHHLTPASPYRPSILPSEMAQATAVLDLFAPILADARDHNRAEEALAEEWERNRVLEARALAAEAALAAERERFESMVRAYEARSLEEERHRLEAAAPLSARETARYLEIERKLALLNAAAIRAEGE